MELFHLKPIVVLLAASVPAMIWMGLFWKKRQNKLLAILTFIGGMIAAKLILIYQGYWDESVNLVFFKLNPVDFKSNIEELLVNAAVAAFFAFVGVGVIEEYAKFWVMRLIDRRYFTSIDEVIRASIICALGFAFFENVLYFTAHWNSLPAAGFFVFVLMRVTVTTMVHMLCSGILGYYYGMAYFASPLLKIQYMKKKTHPVLAVIKRILNFKISEVYADQMLMTGMVLSMVLHALYDYFMTIEMKIAGIPLVIPVILLYFFGGFWLLNSLLQKKDLNLKLGLVGTKVMPKEDFEKLLADIQVIKEKMAEEAQAK